MQDIFGKGMQRWFALKGFHVGIPTEDIEQSLGFEDFQSRVEDFGKLAVAVWGALRVLRKADRFGGLATKVGKWGGTAGAIGAAISLSDFLIDTGATADSLYNALKPYASRADLIGLKISNARVPSTLKEDPVNRTFWNTVLVPVIYADQLTPDSILQRFDRFLDAAAPLKRLGLRAKFVGNRAHIYPLLIYFDSEKLQEDKALLWPRIFEEDGTEGMRPRTLSTKAPWTPELKVKLSAGVVNIPEKWVLSEIFDEDDLYNILEWAQDENSDSN
jgi:hypothetical protein